MGGGGGQKVGKLRDVIYERSLTKILHPLDILVGVPPRARVTRVRSPKVRSFKAYGSASKVLYAQMQVWLKDVLPGRPGCLI